jgi:hypothetical protein
MTSSTAFRFEVEVPADRVVRLPDEVPVGHAEVIVVVTPEPPKVSTATRMDLARALQAAAPRQQTESAELLRQDRDGR